MQDQKDIRVSKETKVLKDINHKGQQDKKVIQVQKDRKV